MTWSVVSSSSTTRTRSGPGRPGGVTGSCPTAGLDLPADLLVVPREQPFVAALVEGEDRHVVDGALVARRRQQVVERGGEVRGADRGRVVAEREAVGGGHRELDVAA